MISSEMKRMIELDQIKVVMEMMRIELLNLKDDIAALKEKINERA